MRRYLNTMSGPERYDVARRCRAILLACVIALSLGAMRGLAQDTRKASPSPSTLAASNVPVDFTREARPILAAHCFKCHGMDEGARKAKLRLDDREVATHPAKSGDIAIVPGKPDQSELVQRIYATNDDIMPPPGAKNPLTDAERDTLKRWITQGAKYEPHWAFIAPKQDPLPEIRDKQWPRNPIDYFVLAHLEKEGLHPSPQADKYVLARRLYLDLIGLPPTPEQADAFVHDTSPDAYEHLVDKLLASPHFGERWARRWLDLARYADSNGYEKDRPRSMWPWRDWVIKALNEDMPFNEFTIEQLAGDMLPHATQDQIIATGFNRNSMFNEEGGIDPGEYRFYSMVDRVRVTGATWLGLTIQCAQCHTHKYDPITHTEYYRFMACLNNASEPKISVVDPDIAKKRAVIQAKIDALAAALPDTFPLRSRVAWWTPGDAAFNSKNGTEAEFLPDGSFLTTGKKTDKDTYTITFTAPSQRITHLELEAIPDEKLPKGGVGNSDSGNFVLDELEMEVRDAADHSAVHRIKFSEARADYAQEDFPEENAIDGDASTGWAVDGPVGTAKQRHLILTLAEPLDLKAPATVTVRLVQDFGAHTTLGRFRLSLGQELPEQAPALVRRDAQRDTAFASWLKSQKEFAANWIPLSPASATSTSPTLTIQKDASVFADGDFSKSDTYTLKFTNLPPGLRAMRLEMMPDDRLPAGGPGSVNHEGPDGDFWLSTVRVSADGKREALTNATDSYASGPNNAAQTLDDDPQTGWSINGGQGRMQCAVFQFTNQVTCSNSLQLEMVCEKYFPAGLGRFRVWVTTNENAKASPLSNEAIATLPRLSDDPSSQTAFAQTNSPARQILLGEFAQYAPEFAQGRRQIEKLRREMPQFATTLVMRERPAGQSRHTYRHHRGLYLDKEEEVTPGVPAFLPPLPDNAPKDRLALARWLVSGANPLTGRVIMNRQWEALFGRGIVHTTGDFGYQGDLPSNQPLLDWLAVEFVKEGWSRKKMLKLMVMSATYQQSSDAPPELLERDPLNILLTRGPRFRMDAEMIRDTALEASGLLSEKIGGPSVFPPQPPGVTTEGAYGPLPWNTSEGPDRYRRGLYTFAKRTAPYAMSAVFDAPSGEECIAQRDRSDTPLQALTMLNDDVIMECAQALGAMAARDAADDSQRAELLFRRCLTRPPTVTEKEELTAFYQGQLARLARGELSAADLLGTKDAPNANQAAAWTAVARVLLNLDETITKG